MLCVLPGAFTDHPASLSKAVDQQSPLLKLEAKIIREYPGDIKLFYSESVRSSNVKLFNAVVEHNHKDIWHMQRPVYDKANVELSSKKE